MAVEATGPGTWTRRDFDVQLRAIGAGDWGEREGVEGGDVRGGQQHEARGGTARRRELGRAQEEHGAQRPRRRLGR